MGYLQNIGDWQIHSKQETASNTQHFSIYNIIRMKKHIIYHN